MDESSARFRREILSHLDAAYNLARWMVGDDADDVVQEAALRAFRSFSQWRGENGRAWLLRIVRNCCFTWNQSGRRRRGMETFDETEHARCETADPGAAVLLDIDRARLHEAIAALPGEFREAIVLRELEQLDYRQIAAVVGVPIGTVMSRLARARERLRSAMRPDEEAR